jgi:hypothetical protein
VVNRGIIAELSRVDRDCRCAQTGLDAELKMKVKMKREREEEEDDGRTDVGLRA